MNRDYLEDIRYTYRLKPRSIWLIVDSLLDQVELNLGGPRYGNEHIGKLRETLDSWYYEETQETLPPRTEFETNRDPGDEDDSKGYGHGV